MKKFILSKLKGVDEKEYVAYKLQCEGAIKSLNSEIKYLEKENKKLNSKITELENELLMYRDPDNWYTAHKDRLSIITSAIVDLNKKDKNDTHNK